MKLKRKIVTAKEISVRKGVPEENIGAVSHAFHVQGDRDNDVIITAHPLSVAPGTVQNGIINLSISVKMLGHLFENDIATVLKDSKLYVFMEVDKSVLREEVQIGIDNSTGDGIYYILDPKKPKSEIYDHINVVKSYENDTIDDVEPSEDNHEPQE